MKVVLICMTVFVSLASDAQITKFENIFKGKTSIKDPFLLRDPFLAPRIRKQDKKTLNTKVSKGKYSNIPKLAKVRLDDLVITGVLIGQNRRAFAHLRGQDKQIYILKEGMRLGENSAELKAIMPGGLILVEKTNNVYGEEEYLETVIPISK